MRKQTVPDENLIGVETNEDLLASLPDDIEAPSQESMPALQTPKGTMIMWLRDDASDLSLAKRRKFHLPRRGDGSILDDTLLMENDRGYLVYGVDAIPAVVKISAMKKLSKSTIDGYNKRVNGSDNDLTQGAQVRTVRKRMSDFNDEELAETAILD
jgi:hypothetical protein